MSAEIRHEAERSSKHAKAPRRRAVMWSIVGTVTLVLVGVLAWSLTDGFTFRSQTLGDSVTAFEASTSVEQDTAGLCGATSETVHCVEGWRTGVGNLLRFPTDSQAEYWQYSIGGDILRNGTLVMDMNGLDLGRDERELAVQMLFPGRDW